MGPSHPPKRLSSTNIEDLDDYLSLLNRLVRNSLQGSKI